MKIKGDNITNNKGILPKIINVLVVILLLFSIFSIIITIINMDLISNNQKGLLVYNFDLKEEKDYTIETSHYLIYKIVKIENNSKSKVYFRFWFMSDIDY